MLLALLSLFESRRVQAAQSVTLGAIAQAATGTVAAATVLVFDPRFRVAASSRTFADFRVSASSRTFRIAA